MKIIFFGSDDFAARHLESLIAKHNVVACVTQPDRAKGRGMKLEFSPIKDMALKHDISVLQPNDLKHPSVAEELKSYQADVFVVIAYGKILPKNILEIPSICSLNLHGSLLPKYRGAAPINWAIINGDQESGLTIIRLNPQMDAGDIVAQMKMNISDADTSQTLREKMMQSGPAFLLETLATLLEKLKKAKPQDASQATLAPKLSKELGEINWNKPAAQIHNLVRGLHPWPGAYTYFQGKVLKILATDVHPEAQKATPGEILEIDKNGFAVATKKDILFIELVKPESGKEMKAYDFVIGHHLKEGMELGR